MTTPLNTRNIGIDLLRGLSLLYIVGYWHMFNYTDAFPEYYNSITQRAALIVLGTFVFLSGYFIGLKNIAINKHGMMQFYKNRLLRIYPLYLIAIGLFMFFGLSDMATSIKAGLIISMLMKPAPLTLWFITMLMIFYIISPLLIHATRTIKISKLTIYYLIFISFLLMYSYFTKMLDNRIILYFPAFALGVFVANKDIKILNKNYVIYALIFMGFSIFISFLKTPYGLLNLLMNTPMVVSCSYFLFRAAKVIVVTSDQASKMIVLLSYSGYCMYLFHRPIYTTLTRMYFPETYLYQIIYLVVFCVPCIILSSFIIQKTYDITVDTLTNKFNGREKATSLI